MSDEFERPDREISLDDQAFLRELGISGMSKSLETALRQYKAAMKAKSAIDARAEGLQALNLSEETLGKLARTRQEPISEIQKKLSFFRDLEKDDSG